MEVKDSINEPFARAIYHGDFKIQVSDLLCVDHVFKQYRLPQSKKKRIRKKWAKNKFNFKWETVHKAIKVGDVIFVSSQVYEKLKQKALEQIKFGSGPDIKAATQN